MKKSLGGRNCRGAFFVVLLALAFVEVLTPVCGAVTPPIEPGITIASFTTDKDIYAAMDEMNVSLVVSSPENVSEVLVKVDGVVSSRGAKYVAYSSKTNLTAGANTFSFTRTIPSSCACSGISQGTYYLDATVTHGGELVKATHSIAITSGPNRVIPVNIVVEETRRMVNSGSGELVLVDVRNVMDYDAAHIKGAFSMPLANLSNSTAALNKSGKIMVYSEDGTNSTLATTLLTEQGFERVYNVVGGINAWNESGYPQVSTAEEKAAIPGFAAVLALAALLAVASRMRERRCS